MELQRYYLYTYYGRGDHSFKIKLRQQRTDVGKFSFLTLTDQNCIQEEIKSSLNRGMLATIRFRVFCHPACCPGM
jgi:hypothetical protein